MRDVSVVVCVEQVLVPRHVAHKGLPQNVADLLVPLGGDLARGLPQNVVDHHGVLRRLPDCGHARTVAAAEALPQPTPSGVTPVGCRVHAPRVPSLHRQCLCKTTRGGAAVQLAPHDTHPAAGREVA